MLTLARLEKRKGHIFVLDCIEKLKKEFSNLQYIIAGENPAAMHQGNSGDTPVLCASILLLVSVLHVLAR